MSEKPLKVEVGKRYRLAGGDVVEIKSHNPKEGRYKFYGDVYRKGELLPGNMAWSVSGRADCPIPIYHIVGPF